MDDMALVPQAPDLEPQVEEEIAIDEALVEDNRVASAYFHPSWAAVEDLFNEVLDSLSQPPHTDLIAEEYKIEGEANKKAKTHITNILDRIKHAVEATERAKGSK